MFELLQQIDDARLVVGLEDIVERLQLERLHRKLLVGGDEDDVGRMARLVQVLGQQQTIDGGDLDIQKHHIHLVILQVFERLQPIFETRHYLDLTVLVHQIDQLLASQVFVFDNNGFQHDNAP
ncbi:hypothetical protein D3C87_640200 [compost metagenome]